MNFEEHDIYHYISVRLTPNSEPVETPGNGYDGIEETAHFGPFRIPGHRGPNSTQSVGARVLNSSGNVSPCVFTFYWWTLTRGGS